MLRGWGESLSVMVPNTAPILLSAVAVVDKLLNEVENLALVSDPICPDIQFHTPKPSRVGQCECRTGVEITVMVPRHHLRPLVTDCVFGATEVQFSYRYQKKLMITMCQRWEKETPAHDRTEQATESKKSLWQACEVWP